MEEVTDPARTRFHPFAISSFNCRNSEAGSLAWVMGLPITR
jgi:hypothetical protein